MLLQARLHHIRARGRDGNLNCFNRRGTLMTEYDVVATEECEWEIYHFYKSRAFTRCC